MRGLLPLVCAATVAGSVHARPDTPGSELFTFDVGDEVETYGNDGFLVHYTRTGTHAVPATDSDGSGVPDHVEQVGAIYEDVLAHFTALGFRAPLSDEGAADDGGDGRFDVYLVDFALSADGAFSPESCSGETCIGYMVQENDFAGYGYPSRTYANRLLASHEFFHAIQAAYDQDLGPAFSEGTAVWASESFDPTLADLEGYGAVYLGQTDNSIDFPGAGPVDAFTYGTGIFYDWLTRTHGDAVLVELLEAVSDGSTATVIEVLDSRTLVDDDLGGLLAGFAQAMLDENGAVLLKDFEELPFFSASFRSFVASFRTVCATRGERDSITVEALAASLDEGDGKLLVQLLAVDGDRVTNAVGPLPLEGGARTLVLDAIDPSAERVCLQVINGRLDGDGSRPALCLGTPAEVDACVADNGGGEGEGEGEGDDNDDPDDGGCAATAPAAGAPLALTLIALSRCVAPRRRRRCAAPTTSSPSPES